MSVNYLTVYEAAAQTVGMYNPNKPSQEKLLYEELAPKLVNPERFGGAAVQSAVVLELPLPETARVYDFHSQPDIGAWVMLDHARTEALSLIEMETAVWSQTRSRMGRAGAKLSWVALGGQRVLKYRSPSNEMNAQFEDTNDRLNNFLEHYHDLLTGEFAETTSGLAFPVTPDGRHTGERFGPEDYQGA